MAPTGAKDGAPKAGAQKAAAPKGKGQAGGVTDEVTDLWNLIRAYALQETVDPLKALGKFLAYGVGGAILLSMGLGFGALALLRALQTQTGSTFTGNLTWIPYVITLVITAAVVAIAVRTITKPNRTDPARP